jgi:hypothetical protein
MSQELTSIESLKDAARGLKEQYDDVYKAAKRAASAIHETLQDTRADAIENDLDEDDDNWYDDFSNRGPGVSSEKTISFINDKPTFLFDDTSGQISDDDVFKNTTLTNAPGLKNDNINPDLMDWLKKQGVKGLATGGYTGSWSDVDGRIGILHQKELVLNPGDTTNLLNSVEILRSMMSSLDGSLFARADNIKSGFYNTSTDEDGLEQNVHIDASFPNVNSKREIEEALSDLVNLAAQRAMRR